MPDSGEWYGYIKGFSLWNCRQIQDGKRQGKQIICCPSGPCIIRRFMSKWTWYRCSRPNQVGGWEPWSHHSLRFFCWFITWPGRSIPEETVCWLGVLKNMLEIDVPSTCDAVYYTFVNSLSWMQSMLILVSRILHCITITQRVLDGLFALLL